MLNRRKMEIARLKPLLRVLLVVKDMGKPLGIQVLAQTQPMSYPYPCMWVMGRSWVTMCLSHIYFCHCNVIATMKCQPTTTVNHPIPPPPSTMRPPPTTMTMMTCHPTTSINDNGHHHPTICINSLSPQPHHLC